MIAPDVNVLVYAVDSESPFHQSCVDWLNQSMNGAETVGFAWQSLFGFIRIGTNGKILRRPLSSQEAFDYVENWLKQKPSQILLPTTDYLPTFRKFVEAAGTANNLVSDASLAALAKCYNAQVVSCDSDFAKFPGLQWFNPVTGQSLLTPQTS